MRFKDNFNRYIDIPLSDDLEMQLWQTGSVHNGYIDLSNHSATNRSKNNFENFEKTLDNLNNK